MLEELAQGEHQRQQRQHQYQDEEETLDSCGLTIHFTVRILEGHRPCVLFQRYKLNPQKTSARWELDTNSKTRAATSFLVEENITQIEKDLLLRWIRTAVEWLLYDTRPEFRLPRGICDNGIDWSSMTTNSGLHYETGGGRTKPLIKRIVEELER